MPPLVTLTTDFGTHSPYVAAMKGVLLSLNADLQLLDLTHEIPPQDVRHAAFYLAGCIPYFPSGSIHLVVVDPGVGTDRAILHVAAGGQYLLAPDNGCWTLAAEALTPTPTVRRVTEAHFWRSTVSATFHGRDIFAPVAAYLSLGIEPAALGPCVHHWERQAIPEPSVRATELLGEVVYIDTFGNLLTNLPGEAFLALAAHRLLFTLGQPITPRVVRTYGEAPPGTLIALVSSFGTLEIAVTRGNAAQQIGCGVGTPILVQREERPGGADS